MRCVLWLPCAAPSPSSPNAAAADDDAAPGAASRFLASGAGDGSVRLWQWGGRRRTHGSANNAGRCLAVLLPDGRALVDRGAQDAWLRAASASGGAAATSSAAAAAAPSTRAPPASVGAASCLAAQALDARGGRVLVAVASAAPHILLWECDVVGLAADAQEAAAPEAAAAASAATGGPASAEERPPRVRLLQRLRIEGCIQHALALTPLPGSSDDADDGSSDADGGGGGERATPALLLASGGTDGAVRLFVRPAFTAAAAVGGSDAVFAPAATLVGHENWVRGLAFVHTDDDDPAAAAAGGRQDEEERRQQQQEDGRQDRRPKGRRRRALLLASASQDTRVRVWRLDPPASDLADGVAAAARGAAAAAAAAAPDGDGDGEGDDRDALLDAALLRYAPRSAVRVPPAVPGSPAFEWTASLEALLSGHEDWVHAVQWRPPALLPAPSPSPSSPSSPSPRGRALHLPPAPQPRASLALLSASHDRTVALWRREPRSRVWLGEVALGDAGATCFGYFGARWAPGGRALVAHGHSGAMHLWRDRDRETEGQSGAVTSGGIGDWRPAAAGGGHAAAVVDLAWLTVPAPPAPAPALGSSSSPGGGGDGRSRGRRRRPRLLLQTASVDQTARLFAEVADAGAGASRPGRRWCELARTQVHGHDFSALAPIPSPPPPPPPPPLEAQAAEAAGAGGAKGGGDGDAPALMYACCSEEKVLRVFEAPQAFLDTLALTWPPDDDGGDDDDDDDDDDDGAEDNGAGPAAAAAGPAAAEAPTSTPPRPLTPEQQLRARGGRRGRPVGAAAQALGLSNKAIFAEDLLREEGPGEGGGGTGGGGRGGPGPGELFSSAEGPDQAPHAAPAAVSAAPLEEHLAQSTLWPEAAKLHGHANDAFCCAASPCGRLLASACRAQASAPREADLLVWEVGAWRAVARLEGGHTLTATQLAFSPDGALLASVSRDRSLAVWRVAAAAPAPAAAAAADSTRPPPEAQGAASPWSFGLVARVPAAHARVIWGVAWVPPSSAAAEGAARFLATGARDGLVRLWEVVSRSEVRRAGQLPAFPAAVMAVAAAPRAVALEVLQQQQQQRRRRCEGAQQGAGAAANGPAAAAATTAILAVGLEDGGVQVWQAIVGEHHQQPEQHRLLWSAGPGQRHAGAVRRLAWAPSRGGRSAADGDGGDGDGDGARSLSRSRSRRRPFLLATCGEDAAVRIFEVFA